MRRDDGFSRELFESAGFALVWGAPTRWYAAHESFADLPCASLDRVIGNTVDDWLQHGATAERTRLLRRLQLACAMARELRVAASRVRV